MWPNTSTLRSTSMVHDFDIPLHLGTNQAYHFGQCMDLRHVIQGKLILVLLLVTLKALSPVIKPRDCTVLESLSSRLHILPISYV